MNLEAIRKYEKIHPRRIHQASPKEDTPPEPIQFTSHNRGPDYLQTQVSDFCKIGVNAHHNRCNAPWCKCPCHDEHMYYGD